MEKRRRERGQSMLELVVAMVVIAWIGLIGSSAIDGARRSIALVAGVSELRALFQRVRMLAIAHNSNVAIRFRPVGDDEWSWTVYEDGDGDGVRNDDINRGVDKLLEQARLFQHPPVRIGVPAAAVPDPANGKLLSLRLPVRFNSSMLCSFSSVGEATNGSVVLTDGKHVTIIRVQGHTANVDVLRWDGLRWREGV